MAERLMQSTVNTFFSGSNPLDTFLLIPSLEGSAPLKSKLKLISRLKLRL